MAIQQVKQALPVALSTALLLLAIRLESTAAIAVLTAEILLLLSLLNQSSREEKEVLFKSLPVWSLSVALMYLACVYKGDAILSAILFMFGFGLRAAGWPFSKNIFESSIDLSWKSTAINLFWEISPIIVATIVANTAVFEAGIVLAVLALLLVLRGSASFATVALILATIFLDTTNKEMIYVLAPLFLLSTYRGVVLVVALAAAGTRVGFNLDVEAEWAVGISVGLVSALLISQGHESPRRMSNKSEIIIYLSFVALLIYYFVSWGVEKIAQTAGVTVGVFVGGLIGFFVVPVQQAFKKVKVPDWQWKKSASKVFGPLKERNFKTYSPERFLFSSAEGLGKYQVSETSAIVMITLVIIGVRLWLYFHN